MASEKLTTGPVTAAIAAMRQADPAHPQKPPQTVRGGFIIGRREETGALNRISSKPYEHGSFEQAQAQAQVLANHNRAEFTVFREVGAALPEPRKVRPKPVVEPVEPAPSPEPVARPLIVERRAKRAQASSAATTGGRC